LPHHDRWPHLHPAVEWDRDAATQAEFAGPHAAGENHVFGFDHTLIGFYTDRAAVFHFDIKDANIFENDCAA